VSDKSEQEQEVQVSDKSEQEQEVQVSDKSEQEQEVQVSDKSEQDQAESEDENSEYDLHPQLQEILQYLADDEHVSLVKKDYILNIETKLDNLQLLMEKIYTKLESSKPDIPLVTADNSDSLVIPLVDLITKYNNTESIGSKALKGFNSIFDATYIYNFTGKADRLKEKLNNIGIKNCHVSSPVIPSNKEECYRLTYFLNDIINHAKTHNYKKINIIADVVSVHKAFAETLYYIMSDIETIDWKLLQYCCMDHKDKNSNFNWQFYLDSNPDLTITTESNAAEHWNTLGQLQGRVCGPNITTTLSNNTLAFAIKDDIYDDILSKLDEMNNESAEKIATMGVFTDIPIKHVSIPNLFILARTGQTICKSLRWYKPNYI
jgi:hypothetical protein